MRTPVLKKRRPGGFTLVETMVATGTASVILGVVILTCIQLHRSFAVYQDYSTGSGQVLQVSDNISADVRRARSVTQVGLNQLTLRIPNYYLTDGKTRRDPTIQLVTRANSRMFEIFYGTGIDQYIEVKYFKQGAGMYRQETPFGSTARRAVKLGERVDFEALYDPARRQVALDVNYTPTIARAQGSTASRPIFVVVDLNLRN
jgi:hypothetical protein